MDVLCAFERHPSHLSRLLREHTQLTFSHYLNRIRLERACCLLADRTLQVKEVARLCGFNDVNYFVRVFRTEMQVTPGNFRHKMRL